MSLKTLEWIVDTASQTCEKHESLSNFLQNIESLLNSEKEKMTEWVLEKSPDKPFVIIGDLHGDLESLRKILSRIYENSLRKNELNIVFLGDYVDRGPYQVETITSVLLLKSIYPERITVLKGNHEPLPQLIPYPHDFPDILRTRYGYVKGGELYDEFMKIFQLLPAVLHVKKEAIMLHGGLPTETFKKEVTIYSYFTGRFPEEQRKVIEEILWNDPIESNMDRIPSPRGAGYLFGRPVTEWVARKFKVKAVFRGHEPVDNGYKLNHGGKIVTLFSRLGPPYFNRKASYAVVDFTFASWWRRIKNFIVSFTE